MLSYESGVDKFFFSSSAHMMVASLCEIEFT